MGRDDNHRDTELCASVVTIPSETTNGQSDEQLVILHAPPQSVAWPRHSPVASRRLLCQAPCWHLHRCGSDLRTLRGCRHSRRPGREFPATSPEREKRARLQLNTRESRGRWGRIAAGGSPAFDHLCRMSTPDKMRASPLSPETSA